MPRQDRLLLHEEVLLLALRDDKGTVASGTMYSYGLGGAILTELILAERARIVTPKKTALLELVSPGRMDDPVLEECLERVRDAKKRASLQTWVSRFATVKNLRHRVAEGLCQRRILRAEEGKILGIFSRKIYPELDPGPEKRIVERLRRAIFGAGSGIDPRTVTLVSLAHHTGLLKVVFDKKDLKRTKPRIEKIMNGDLTAKATAEAIQAVQTAVLVAAILPVVFSTTVVHH